MFDGLVAEHEHAPPGAQHMIDDVTARALHALLAISVVTDIPAGIVLDVAAVHAIDASGIAALAFLFKRLAAEGRALRLQGVNGCVFETLRDHGLARILCARRSEPVPATKRARRRIGAMLAFAR